MSFRASIVIVVCVERETIGIRHSAVVIWVLVRRRTSRVRSVAGSGSVARSEAVSARTIAA